MSFVELCLENSLVTHAESQKKCYCTVCKSAKHAAGKKCIDSKEKRERNIAEMLQAYDKKVHPSGEPFLSVSMLTMSKW